MKCYKFVHINRAPTSNLSKCIVYHNLYKTIGISGCNKWNRNVLGLGCFDFLQSMKFISRVYQWTLGAPTKIVVKFSALFEMSKFFP